MIAAVAATLAAVALMLTVGRRITARRLTAAHLDGYMQGVDEGARQAGLEGNVNARWQG